MQNITAKVTVDKQYANSDLSVILGKAGQPFTLDAQRTRSVSLPPVISCRIL